MTPAFALAAASVVLLFLRLVATFRVGFGDAEALYATYALHPQPLYLDHPGLVGAAARLIGRGVAPSPLAAHLATTLLSTALPFVAVLAARMLGASRHRAALAGLALVAAPEIAVGLFAMTPDLLLAPLWLGALGLAGLAVRGEPGEHRSLFAFLGAGAAAGLAADAKATGVLLIASLALSFATRPCRRHLATPGPWLGLAMALLLISPVVSAELGGGLPMLHHRLVDTQGGAGVSIRNFFALLGGQLAYVSPLLCAAGAIAGADLVRRGGDLPSGALLRTTLLAAGAPLAALCLWSRVAEPHWLAPALLSLPLWVALRPEGLVPERLGRWAVGTGLLAALVAHGWALTDLAPRLPSPLYEARYDLANDLYAWQPSLPALRVLRSQAEHRWGEPPPVLAPHWTVAAQIAAGLGPGAAVSTVPGSKDDFTRWLPPEKWQNAPAVVWVSDDRFGLDRPSSLASRQSVAQITVPISRGGRVVRRVRIELLVSEDEA